MGNSGRIERFEDIFAWQKSRQLAGRVYQVTRRSPFAQDFGLSKQIQRAAVSVMSNIAEGFERYSKREFAHFLSVAKGSLAEVRSQLYLAHDLGYVNDDEFSELQGLAIETKRLILGLHGSLQESAP
jgi:four helix bundle protein